MAPKSASRRRTTTDPSASGFAAGLRRARLDRDLTLREVSQRSGVSIPYLSDLERGVLVNPTLDTLKKIAEALAVSLNELLGVQHQEPTPRFPKPLEEFLRDQHFRDALEEQAKRERVAPEELEDEWRRAMAAIRIRGRAPRQPSDYLFIFEAVRRALDRG